MVASAASEVVKSHRGMVWIIALVCLAAWSVDAVLAWTATEVMPPHPVPANADYETYTPIFDLSRWRNIALQARGTPGTELLGTLTHIDGSEQQTFKMSVRRDGRATTFLPSPKHPGPFLMRVRAQSKAPMTLTPQLTVHQGRPGAHTAWWFYGFNAAAMLIFVVCRMAQRMRAAQAA
jgi:hypothetical protein